MSQPAYTGSKAMLGVGSKLGYATLDMNGAVTGDYTYLRELMKFPLPKETAPKVKTTNMESTGLKNEYIPGFGDSGEIDFNGNFRTAEYIATRAILRQMKGWQIILPDNTPITFKGYLSELGGDVELDKPISAEGKIVISGDVTMAAGTGTDTPIGSGT